MPSPYAADAARLKAEIVARVEAGERLKGVCASPGLPGVLTVRAWSRADPLFGEALAAARRRADWRRLWVVDEVVAAAFLARARAGEPIRSLLGRPGMPSQTAYRRWKRVSPDFAAATSVFLPRRDAHTRRLGLASRRDFDQAVADRIIVRFNKSEVGIKALLKGDPDLPSREVVARWRREQPEFDAVLKTMIAAKRRMGRPVPEAVIEDVVGHIVEGGSFASYARQPGGPSFNTLRGWMRDPAFAAEVARACDWREDWFADQILAIAMEGSPQTLGARKRAIGELKRQVVRLRHRPAKPLYPSPRKRR